MAPGANLIAFLLFLVITLMNLEALTAKQLGTGFPGDGVISCLEMQRILHPPCPCSLDADYQVLLVGKVDGGG